MGPVGILLQFPHAHPDIPPRATFFVNFPHPFGSAPAERGPLLRGGEGAGACAHLGVLRVGAGPASSRVTPGRSSPATATPA